MLLVLLASTRLSAQQWTRIENLPAAEFTALEIIDGTLFAATSAKLYHTNDGQNWQQATISALPIEPMCLAKFDGRLYVGTGTHGIFSAPLGNINGVWTHHIGTINVSAFAEKDNVLYVSTVGHGLYRRNANGQFLPFSNELPNYSFNVSKIISAPSGLIATAGANGTFYRYDAPNARWAEDYYQGSYSPGLHMDDAIRIDNTIYVSRFNKLLRSEDSGENWTMDQVGLPNGHYRFLYASPQTLYTLTNIFTGDQNITFLRKRDRNAPSQTSWANAPEVLPFYTYALREFADNLFAAGHNGLYAKFNPNLGTETPEAKKDRIAIYPNPSVDGNFTASSDNPINEVQVFDLTGKQVAMWKSFSGTCEFAVARGIYVVKVVSENAVQHFKIISQQ